MKKIIKKALFIFVFVFLILVLMTLSNYAYTSFLNKLFVENSNEKIREIFVIDKILFFSSCYSDSTVNSNATTTINNLSQYTDIAIFINNATNDFNMENTLKSVSIKDLSFNTQPKLGTPKLYYKSLKNFSNYELNENNLIKSDLNFSVSSDDEIDYNSPIIFNNCANPITLSYINNSITNNYTLQNNVDSISYDGTLLKNCNILLDDLNCSLSFTIYIENNFGEKFRCPVYIDIPLKDENKSIYGGSYTYTYNPNYIFYKY